MYTATLLGTTKNIELRRLMVNIEFTDGTNTFAKEFQFKIDETVLNIKRAVNEYLNELNYVPPTIDDLTPPPEDTPPAPTAEEVARDAWLLDWRNLQAAKKLEAAGASVLTTSQMTALQNKVKSGFQNSYVDYV